MLEEINKSGAKHEFPVMTQKEVESLNRSNAIEKTGKGIKDQPSIKCIR